MQGIDSSIDSAEQQVDTLLAKEEQSYAGARKNRLSISASLSIVIRWNVPVVARVKIAEDRFVSFVSCGSSIG